MMYQKRNMILTCVEIKKKDYDQVQTLRKNEETKLYIKTEPKIGGYTRGHGSM